MLRKRSNFKIHLQMYLTIDRFPASNTYACSLHYDCFRYWKRVVAFVNVFNIGWIRQRESVAAPVNFPIIGFPCQKRLHTYALIYSSNSNIFFCYSDNYKKRKKKVYRNIKKFLTIFSYIVRLNLLGNKPGIAG